MGMARDNDQDYYAATRASLEEASLEAEDPRAGSGFRGDAKRWELARGPIASAIDRDGAFLDVGCANGLLMQSLADWAGEDGFRIEPYGLELIPPWRPWLGSGCPTGLTEYSSATS